MQKRFTWQDSHRPGEGIELDLGPWKLVDLRKEVPFVLEFSWNFVKSFLKYEIVFENINYNKPVQIYGMR